MPRQIKMTERRLPAIRSTSVTQPRIEAHTFKEGLNAETGEESIPALVGGPPSLMALRRELSTRLRATGGRRKLEGTVRRQKIPLTEEDWERLVSLAGQSSTDEALFTPGQIASALLHQALVTLKQESS